MRQRFWSSDARAAVTVVFTWSVSLMTRARSWPPRVRWKKPSGSTWRCSNSWTRRSRTTPSWIATLQTAAAYERAFLSTSVPSSTATTLRSAPSGDPAASSGPATGEHPLDARAAAHGNGLLPEQRAQEGDEQHERGPVHHRRDERRDAVGHEEERVGTKQREQSAAAAHSARSPPSRSGAAAPWREQRHGKDHLLGRDAAVQERTAVARLVLAQLGGIDEEGVRRREQQPHPQPHRRQAERLQVIDRDRGLGVLAPQILAELVPQVRGRVALCVHGGGGLAVDRAVVRGEQHEI